MKTSLWTSRVFVIAVIAVSLGALWVTLRTFHTAVPALSSGEMDQLANAVVSQSGASLSERNSALDGMAAPGSINYRNPAWTSAGDPSKYLDRAREDQTRSLTVLGSEIARGYADGRLVASPALASALDQADALYQDRLDRGIEASVTTYMDSMSREAPFYLNYIAYLVLRNTVDRDLLSYREKNSLPLNDIKSALYKSESQSNRKQVDQIRSDADAVVKRQDADLEAQYATMVDTLAGIYVDKLESDSRNQQGSSGKDGILNYISSVLTAFNVSTPALSANQNQGPDQAIDAAAWVNLEKESSVKFGTASGLMTK